MKELLHRVNDNPDDPKAKEMALMMFRTATLRSGFMLRETADFALAIEQMMRQTLGIPLDEMPDEEEEYAMPADTTENAEEEIPDEEEHDEL